MRSVAGARTGLTAWLWQRGTAVAMLLLLIALAGHVWRQPWSGYEAWRALIAPLPVRIGLVLFFFGLYVHVWLGVREIVMDYVPLILLRLALYALTLLALAGLALWLIHLLLRV